MRQQQKQKRYTRLMRCSFVVGFTLCVFVSVSAAHFASAQKGEIIPPKWVKTDNSPVPECAGFKKKTLNVDFTIGTDGIPADIKTGKLTDAMRTCVLLTVGRQRYQPATQDGIPVPMKIHLKLIIDTPKTN